MDGTREGSGGSEVGDAGGDQAQGGRPRRKKGRVVGYMQGRGAGQTWKPDESLAQLREEAQEMRRRLDGLIEDLEEAEKAFTVVRRALDRTQPPMFNRFQVRWWKHRGGGPRVPTLVIVRGTPRGEERPEVVRDRRTKPRKDGGFGLNHDLNLRVIDLYWALWALRGEARDRWARVAEAFRGMRPVAPVITRRIAELEELREEATERLRQVGYEFGERPEVDGGQGEDVG